MVPKLAEDYTFDIVQAQDPPRSTIVLTQISSGTTKTFTLAGEKKQEYLVNFMNSLTDDQCSSWFTSKDHKAKNKKK